jgi:cyclase
MLEHGVPRRVIPCLDVHNGRVVKGEQFIHLVDSGDPVELARQYEANGADELVLLDISATTEARRTVTETARRVAQKVFIPFTIGGGIRSVGEAQAVLDNGADKIAVNSAALERPQLLSELARHLGRQSVVLSIDAKRSAGGTTWEAYTAGGTKPSGRDVVDWAKQGVELGAGEILLTSIDSDGRNDGYDLELLRKVTAVVNVPVIASGGAGLVEHFGEALLEGRADAVLGASTLHRGDLTIQQIKKYLSASGVVTRPIDQRALDLSANLGENGPRVAIVDYGMGNRASVANALTYVGAEAIITNDDQEILTADGVILPGVGSFPAAMDRLGRQDLISTLNQFRSLGKPLLGICLGHQLLFDRSDEHGGSRGLGWIGGKVAETDSAISPNIGWRSVGFDNTPALTEGLGSEELFYHAHEFAARPSDPGVIKGRSALGGTVDGQPSSAVTVVEQQRIYGTQFHPEKSSYAGLKLLQNFANISASLSASR